MEPDQKKRTNHLALAIWRYKHKARGFLVITLPMVLSQVLFIPLTLRPPTALGDLLLQHSHLINITWCSVAMFLGTIYNYHLSLREANLLLKIKANKYAIKWSLGNLIITGEITIAGEKTEAQISIPYETADAFDKL